MVTSECTSLIIRMRDKNSAKKKAMAKEFSPTILIKTAITRKSSKANVEAMRARPSTTVNRVSEGDSEILS